MSLPSGRMRHYLICLAVGFALVACSGRLNAVTPAEVIAAATALAVALTRPAVRAVARLDRWLAALPPRRHAALIAFLTALLPDFFLFAAWSAHRPLCPLIHDEQMYLLQARQFASGHLAMPALPLGQFFETFYVFVKPVYASMYFPGTALAYVPSIWLGLPFCVWPLLICTALCVMTYCVASRIVGRLLALVTVYTTLGAAPMSSITTATMSHPLGGLLGLAAIYGWLRWRAAPRAGWAMLIGAAAGWMAITRPLESLAYAVPIGVAIAFATRPATLRRTLVHAVIALAVASPFAMLQLATDHAITGHWLTLPISQYVQQEFTDMTAMGATVQDVQSTSSLPQKQDMIKQFVAPMARDRAKKGTIGSIPSRTATMLNTSLASPLLVVLLALAVPLLARSAEARVFCGIFVMYSLGYMIYFQYLQQYSAQIMGVMTLLAVVGISQVITPLQAGPDKLRAAAVLIVTAITTIVLFITPYNTAGGQFDWRLMEFNYQALPRLAQAPAIVLYRYGPKSFPFAEPVYNLEAAQPDDCPIIRAHDLGPVRDQALFAYYAAIQPQRQVYRYDRDTSTFTLLGRVDELARRPATAP